MVDHDLGNGREMSPLRGPAAEVVRGTHTVVVAGNWEWRMLTMMETSDTCDGGRGGERRHY